MPDSRDPIAAPGREGTSTPRIRIRRCNDARVAADGVFVLYWMTSARRTRWNFGLQRAAELCIRHGLPVLVLEPLRVGYRWASDRFHRFIVDGMIDNQGHRRHRRFPCLLSAPDAGSRRATDFVARRGSRQVMDCLQCLPRMAPSQQLMPFVDSFNESFPRIWGDLRNPTRYASCPPERRRPRRTGPPHCGVLSP